MCDLCNSKWFQNLSRIIVFRKYFKIIKAMFNESQLNDTNKVVKTGKKSKKSI